MAGQPMKASEVLIKKDSRHGSTVVTYHDKKMTVPIKTSQDNDQSHSVLMNAESSCSQCSEPITASLGRRKRKVIVRSASSDDTKHVKTNGILNGDNGYVTLDGKRRQCHWDSDPPARQNVGSTRDMDGHLEETKVQMIIPSGASSNAIMDVIIKARNMASDRKFYDPSAPDVDHTSYLDIDEALRDDRFTDEFKDAVEELRMVPFIKIRCPEFPAVTWPRQSPPKSPPEKNSLETSDYETLEKQKPDKHKMNHSKYSRSTHSTQSERIDVRSTSGTTTAHTVPRYPKNSTTRNDFHDVKHNKASPLLQLKPVRYKPVQLQPHVTSKEPHNGNNYSKLTTDRILTLSPSDGNSSRDNCQTPPDKHCGQVKHDHREASTGRSAETIILDNLVIPDYNANIEDSFRASMEDVFEHELSMVERRKLSLRDSCHSSSPDSLVEKILDDVDSEVYDESAKLNRIFSVRSDETTTNKPQESGNESANDISPVDSISTSSAEANDTIDHELDVSLEDALHDFEEVLQYSGRPEHRSSDSSPETIGTDTVKPGHLGNPLQQIINSSYQLHFSVNDSTEELFEDVMESMAAIEEEDEEVDGSISGEYDTEDGRVVLNTPRSSDASDLQNGNSVLHKSPNSSCEALLGDRTQSIDMPNGIREEAGGNASDDVSVDFTLSGGSSDNLLDCDRRVTYDEFKSDTVDFTELLQSLDDKSEISSHGVNQTSGHTLHTDVSISRNRTLLRDSRTSSSGGVVEETFSDNGTNYITETVDLNVVPDHPISPLAVTKNFDFTSSNQQTIVRKTTFVTSVPSSHKVLTDVTQSPSSIVNPTSTKPKKIPPPVPPRKYKPKVIAEVSHPRLAVTVPEHKLVEQPRIDPVTEPSLPTHYTDSFYEGRIPLPTSPSVEYAPRILRVQDDNNMAKSNGSTSHRESEIKYGTSGECDTFRISRKEEKDVEFLVKTDMVDQCNIDNDKLKERSGNDEHEELLDNEGSVGSLLDKEIQQCISSTSRSGSSSGSESDVESGNDCLETDDVCEDDIFGSGITGDPQTNRRSGLPSEGDTLKQAHEAANIINHLFVQRCIREEMCDGDVSSSLIDDEEEEVIGRDYPPYDTTTTDEASDTSITSDNEANRDSVNVTETETRPCLNENVTSELTHCLQDICQSSEPIPSDGVVLSEEVITQEIAFVISVPTKKKKKHIRNKKDKDVVKKGDPARSLHLHRVTRLTDLDVELMGGSKLKSLADTPSSGTHREENSRVLSPESLGEDKIPLDESLEQHAHDQRMPVVVEVRGHHSSSSSSGPLTPNSIGSPYSSKCNTPRQSPGASSKSPEFSDRMSSRTSSVDSLRQEMRGSNSVDSGEDRPPSRGLRSPLSPVPVEVEFEQKESSQSTEVANLSNSPVNIQREDSLKIMQVPHTTDAFLGSLQETVSKMSSLLLRGIAFNKDLQVKIGCEASETYLPRPDSASVQTLTVSDTIVDTTAHNALTQGSAKDEEKESSRDLCTVPSGN